MAKYIKGNSVANATEYVLLEKGNAQEITSLGLGSADLFASSTTGYLAGSQAITGYVFGIGAIASDKQIAGARLAISPYDTTAENATKIYIYLYTVENLPLASNGRVAFEATVNPTLVASGSKDILVANNTANSIVDVTFDEPYYNTNGKFLMLGYNLDTGSKRRKASPDITGAAACQANDGNTYEPLYTWYSTSKEVTSQWNAGYDDTAANAYTLLTTRAGSGESYSEIATASDINFNLSALSLASGNYTFVVKAKAEGYEDSDYSNEVTYTV